MPVKTNVGKQQKQGKGCPAHWPQLELLEKCVWVAAINIFLFELTVYRCPHTAGHVASRQLDARLAV